VRWIGTGDDVEPAAVRCRGIFCRADIVVHNSTVVVVMFVRVGQCYVIYCANWILLRLRQCWMHVYMPRAPIKKVKPTEEACACVLISMRSPNQEAGKSTA